MPESKRDAVVRLLSAILTKCRLEDGVNEQELEEAVDAIIEAARAPESQHTRDITAAQRKALNDPRV